MTLPKVALVGDRSRAFRSSAAAMQTQLRCSPVGLRDFVQSVLRRSGQLGGGARRHGVDAPEKFQPEFRRLLPGVGE